MSYASPQPAGGKAELVEIVERQIEAGTLRKSADMPGEIARRIAEIDKRVGDQINTILHHPEFQRLEAAWRGLHSLVKLAGDVGGDIQIRALNISKAELAKDLSNPRFDASETWKKVYENAYGIYGGKPYGVLVGDYEFSNHPQDVQFLKKMSGVAAASHAPFLAAAAPGLLQLRDFTEHEEIASIAKHFEGPEYAAWRAFRATPDSKYVALCLPHVLLRLPYGEDTVPVDGLAFEEDVDGRTHDKYLWGNAAYALAGRMVEAFSAHSWCAAIRGPENGGLVRDLPWHTYRTDAGTTAAKCPVEVSLPERRAKEFNEAGFIVLEHHVDENFAAFFAVNSCHLPPKYSTDEANKNARLGTQLPYMMTVSRIAHYLKAQARDKIGSFMSVEDCDRYLNTWISKYVTEDDTAAEDTKRKFPLRQARIEVREVAGRPGAYEAVAFLRPHFQLDELTMSLQLVAQVPEPRG